MKEYLPFVGVGFVAGFIIGILIYIFCLSTIIP